MNLIIGSRGLTVIGNFLWSPVGDNGITTPNRLLEFSQSAAQSLFDFAQKNFFINRLLYISLRFFYSPLL